MAADLGVHFSLIDWASTHIHVLYAPNEAQEIPKYYLFWMSLYAGINLIWDYKSSRTANFHIGNLKHKVNVIYNAVTFASSLLLIMGFFDDVTRKLASDTYIPILTASLAGLFITISGLCPYDPTAANTPSTGETPANP